jgi:hypothetical protein
LTLLERPEEEETFLGLTCFFRGSPEADACLAAAAERYVPVCLYIENIRVTRDTISPAFASFFSNIQEVRRSFTTGSTLKS